MPDDIQGIINPDGKKTLSPSDILEGRKRLVNNFGGKIAGKSKPSWTAEEKAASVAYHTLTETLYKLAPETKNSDQIYRLYEKNEVNGLFGLILKYAIKSFWVILTIAVFLAVLKFILS